MDNYSLVEKCDEIWNNKLCYPRLQRENFGSVSTFLDTNFLVISIIQLGSIFEKKEGLRGQSNLTRININHSSFTGLFTRPTLQQPPGATLETTLAWSQSVADYNVPSEVFHFQTFHSQRSPRHAPNWFHIAELFHFWTGWLRVSIIFGMNTGCVLIIWIFFFNIFIWKCKMPIVMLRGWQGIY